MARFNQRSSDRLSTCDQRIIAWCNFIVIERDCTIIEGHRSEIFQNIAFQNKKSRLPWPLSRHNKYPSMAVDIAPWDASDPGIKWNDLDLWEDFALYGQWASEKLGIKILNGGLSWGWDWPHHQLED